MATHSQADIELIDGLSSRVLREFRDYMFTPAFVHSNPLQFLDTSWIQIPALRSFLQGRDKNLASESGGAAFITARVKREPDASDAPLMDLSPKLEPLQASELVRTRIHLDGAIEILDSDDDGDMSARSGSREGTISGSSSELNSDSRTRRGSSPALDSEPEIRDGTIRGNSPELDFEPGTRDGTTRGSSPELDSEPSWTSRKRWRESSPTLQDSDNDSRGRSPESDQSERAATPLQESDTLWLDPHVSSAVRVVKTTFTSNARTYVERMEYLTELPSGFPVPRVSTAFVVDLSDPKFNILDNNGNLISVDVLVAGEDNDSWRGSSGAADPTVNVKFGPDEVILCRRKRQTCRGCHHCSSLDKKLVEVTRHELDAASRSAVIEAARENRRHEGDTAEQRATAFFDRVKSSQCKAKRADGKPCGGRPKLMLKKEGKSYNHLYWIACDGWTPSFKEDHRTHSIPVQVDEALLIKLFAGESLADNDSVDTKACSRIVHPHIGAKLKVCRHAHIVNGRAVPECPIKFRPCPSRRTYYIPVDTTIRKVLIFHPNKIPHNHPIAPPRKLSHGSKSAYRHAVQAVGLLGTTVAKVDNAPSTRLLLGGQRPAQYAPALHDSRVKQDIIAREKKRKYPAGLGVNGAYDLYRKDLEKPLEERYIHRFQHTPDGGLIIFTCFTRLLALLDDPGVTAFEDDTTFKRVEGDMNEWEVVIFLNALERAITLARAYINRANTSFFETLFDIFREIKREATGRDIGFARFMPNGNLLVMNADMEAAQALGAAKSLLKTNVPTFSNITTVDPHLFATFFIKFCATHAKRPLPEFRSLVSPQQYEQLKNFMYIESVEDLKSFSAFVADLGVKKIQDWWDHKEMNDWVIPCLVKSQSNILPEHWDRTPATTNTGEAQHHWTNARTGIKLTLVEGIESARIVDHETLQDVELSTTTGILYNSNNEVFHRQGRNSQRHAQVAKKKRESEKLGERKAALQAQMNDEKAKLDATKAEYKALGGASSRSTASSSRNSDDTVIISASSSGRVKTAPLPRRAKASTAATVPPSSSPTLSSTPDDPTVPPLAAGPIDTPVMVETFEPPQRLSGLENYSDFFASEAPPLPFSVSSYSSYEGPAFNIRSVGDPPAQQPMCDFSDFGLPNYGSESDFAFGKSIYDYDLSMFDLPSEPANGSFPTEFDAAGSRSTPAQYLDTDQDFMWPVFSPQPDLPILPPPPASSPPPPPASPPRPERTDADADAPTPPPIKKIVLDLDSRNVVQVVPCQKTPFKALNHFVLVAYTVIQPVYNPYFSDNCIAR
ncbi:hypothetical protein C8R46DRAFT_1235973 [Mycena filopes]|nr:hypothetical protein C8R46DRAFT_1235973 [Mycena filopes]